MTLPLLRPAWPAPASVRAATTTRAGGVSAAPFATFNLGAGAGDDREAVAANRARLERWLGAPIGWPRQVHGISVVRAGATDREADAVITDRPGVPCAVLTADCLPVLLADEAGERIGCVHAGWRGLAAGVIEAAVEALGGPRERLLAWLGPAISAAAFEVGGEVREAFLRAAPEAAIAFRAGVPGKWFADLPALARQRLAALGVTRVYGGDRCTFREPEHFYSYRRDGVTGRMATVIMISER